MAQPRIDGQNERSKSQRSQIPWFQQHSKTQNAHGHNSDSFWNTIPVQPLNCGIEGSSAKHWLQSLRGHMQQKPDLTWDDTIAFRRLSAKNHTATAPATMPHCRGLKRGNQSSEQITSFPHLIPAEMSCWSSTSWVNQLKHCGILGRQGALANGCQQCIVPKQREECLTPRRRCNGSAKSQGTDGQCSRIYHRSELQMQSAH